MDMLNFLLSIVLIFIALSAGQTWIVFALIILSVLSFKSVKVSLALVITAVVVYFAVSSDDPFANFPLIIVGLLVVALILGVGSKPEEPAGMMPDMGAYGGMFGGEGGGF